MDDQETRTSASLRPDQLWLLAAAVVTAVVATVHLLSHDLDESLSPMLAGVVVGSWCVYATTRSEARTADRIDALRRELQQHRTEDFAAGFVEGAGGVGTGRVVPIRRSAT
ncbi:hypothetical protein KIF24_01755 [Micromonospora sp. Llam7]|uniref:hypothetical protein n=1 Tax=Micromonospora tarapacensis TaxID=2835305 RepID=UPI001C82B56B|nr:hypothetical protein [Micromonospora tarapacensis]MBX7264899.1 hypothetical protein [Micromonospora tarapacensis]